MTRETDTDLLFVYGTLRRGCMNGCAQALYAASNWLGPAWVRGRLYCVDWYPALLIDDQAGHVAGDLFRLHDPVAALAELDKYEETGIGFPEPWEYQRKQILVEHLGGPTTAWAYIFNRPATGLIQIAGGDFLASQ